MNKFNKVLQQSFIVKDNWLYILCFTISSLRLRSLTNSLKNPTEIVIRRNVHTTGRKKYTRDLEKNSLPNREHVSNVWWEQLNLDKKNRICTDWWQCQPGDSQFNGCGYFSLLTFGVIAMVLRGLVKTWIGRRNPFAAWWGVANSSQVENPTWDSRKSANRSGYNCMAA